PRRAIEFLDRLSSRLRSDSENYIHYRLLTLIGAPVERRRLAKLKAIEAAIREFSDTLQVAQDGPPPPVIEESETTSPPLAVLVAPTAVSLLTLPTQEIETIP